MEYNAVGWFEIYVSDMARAKKFYETVFQRKLTDMPMTGDSAGMQMALFEGSMEAKNISGALVYFEGVKPGMGGTLVYFTSVDCTTEEARVEAAGGKIHRPKMSIGEYGFISLIYDTEGNMIGLHSLK